MKALAPLIVAAATLLTGCYAMPLDAGQSFPMVIRSPLPAGEAFRRLYLASRACYPAANPRLTANYSPDTKHGTLTYSAGVTTMAIELGQVEVQRDLIGSVVMMRLRSEGRSEFASAVPAWLRGETVACPYGLTIQKNS